MKKLVYLCMCLCLLWGCGTKLGTFQKGTMNMEILYQKIMDQKVDSNWKYELLQNSNWTHKTMEEKYHLDMTKVSDAFVRSSIIEMDCNELAFFKVSKKNEHYVREAIQQRMNDMLSTWVDYRQDVQERIDHALQGRIGQYYYFVVGEDSKKVVNYIRNIK